MLNNFKVKSVLQERKITFEQYVKERDKVLSQGTNAGTKKTKPINTVSVGSKQNSAVAFEECCCKVLTNISPPKFEYKKVSKKTCEQASGEVLDVNNPNCTQNGIRMGSGRCKVCDCPQFEPSSTGRTCIGRNSAGGSCNHLESAHY